MRVAIVDGYVDEPSCLGVPPYISPYPRYIYGMLRALKINPLYTTIDAIRENYKLKRSLYDFDLVIVIAGMVVPGKYLGGKPASLKELINLFPATLRKILVGPIVIELSDRERRLLENYEIFGFPFEHQLFRYLSRFAGHAESAQARGRDFVNRFAILGAEVVKQHPDFPNIICEIETYKGCYWRKCSFCIERIHGEPNQRDPMAVIAEIEALYNQGCRYFRLGNQTDFMSYMGDFSHEVPRPNAEKMWNFHREIWRRCPKIRTLHIDNVNPKTISEWREESREIIKCITVYQTPGNVAAMGLESADERVIEENSLAAHPDEVLDAIELINRYGKFVGYNGLPYFLPGLNFVAGLKGETRETFEKNYEFLESVMERGLLLRRINIRQVKIYPGTQMYGFGDRLLKKHKKHFKVFKEKVRKNIDNTMLRRVLPKGRKLTDLRCEVVEGNITFARQLATYPILVGIQGKYPRNEFLDARVVDYGRRSVTAIKC
ncbi:putative Fe-S oxidoreductase [Archaeoglobus sulfaticallidus PM70-1]|uniref:Putative Fe-S oxidoreductase n=1 Tax=Archaeoglobus sulfaticallidus PM70-1 TaxID=387631 RepID=N0BEI2_9EURY|nr:radical SAM protein [Archaeoglobus sulfaticallidus]AGK61423.1 putative Fe-S oxidoreductase [Archaeoglobus sulfaticallidus PM70-1]